MYWKFLARRSQEIEKQVCEMGAPLPTLPNKTKKQRHNAAHGPRARPFWTLLRFIVAAGIFYFLWRRFQRLEAGLAWNTIAPGWLALSLAVMFGRTVFAVWRWQLLLANSHIYVKPGYLYRLTLVSQFLGLMLPGSLSGADMFKVWQLGANLRKRAEIAATLTLARLHGLMSFLFLGAAGSLMYWLAGGSAAFMIATGSLLTAILASDWLLRHRSTWLRRLVEQRMNEHGAFARFFRTFLTSNLNRRLWLKSLLLSLLFQSGIIAVVLLTAKAAAIPAHVKQCLFAVPLSSIVSLLPVTPSGFGIREGSGAVLLRLAGVPEAAALRLMLLVMAQFLAYIAVGGVLFALRPEKTKPERRSDDDHETDR